MASVLWSLSPFLSSNNFLSSIVCGSGHPIYAAQIALSPVCVLSSFAPPASSFESARVASTAASRRASARLATRSGGGGGKCVKPEIDVVNWGGSESVEGEVGSA